MCSGVLPLFLVLALLLRLLGVIVFGICCCVCRCCCVCSYERVLLYRCCGFRICQYGFWLVVLSLLLRPVCLIALLGVVMDVVVVGCACVCVCVCVVSIVVVGVGVLIVCLSDCVL